MMQKLNDEQRTEQKQAMNYWRGNLSERKRLKMVWDQFEVQLDSLLQVLDNPALAAQYGSLLTILYHMMGSVIIADSMQRKIEMDGHAKSSSTEESDLSPSESDMAK